MRLRVLQGERSFFDLFEKLATTVLTGAEELLDLLKNYSDLDKKTQRVLDIEHEGDELTHEVMRRLNTSFVTPFDREDIQQLASNLDDVLDHIEAAAEFLQLHKIDQPLPQMISLMETLTDASRKTAAAMPSLRKYEGPRPILDRDQSSRERGRPVLPTHHRRVVLGRLQGDGCP